MVNIVILVFNGTMVLNVSKNIRAVRSTSHRQARFTFRPRILNSLHVNTLSRSMTPSLFTRTNNRQTELSNLFSTTSVKNECFSISWKVSLEHQNCLILILLAGVSSEFHLGCTNSLCRCFINMLLFIIIRSQNFWIFCLELIYRQMPRENLFPRLWKRLRQ